MSGLGLLTDGFLGDEGDSSSSTTVGGPVVAVVKATQINPPPPVPLPPTEPVVRVLPKPGQPTVRIVTKK